RGKLAALHEREGACAAERAGGVGRSSPGGFVLVMVDAGEEELRFLGFEGSESFGEVVLGPALGVGLHRIGGWHEARERSDEVGEKRRELQLENMPRAAGDDQVAAMSKSFAENGERFVRRQVSGGVDRSELGVEVFACGHVSKAERWDRWHGTRRRCRPRRIALCRNPGCAATR